MKIKKAIKKKKGFTLVEVIIAMFIFALMMTVITGIFVSFIKANKHTKAVQRDLEDAEYAMNIMAKIMRTSSIVTIGADKNTIEIYDHSQAQCIGYNFSGGNLRARSASPAVAGDPASCPVPLASATYQNITNSGNILLAESGFVRKVETVTASYTVGYVTILITVREPGSTDKAKVQTTVSLHDFTEVGP